VRGIFLRGVDFIGEFVEIFGKLFLLFGLVISVSSIGGKKSLWFYKVAVLMQIWIILWQENQAFIGKNTSRIINKPSCFLGKHFSICHCLFNRIAFLDTWNGIRSNLSFLLKAVLRIRNLFRDIFLKLFFLRKMLVCFFLECLALSCWDNFILWDN